MNINDLFKRPSFNFIANQGWMFFILLMALQSSVLFVYKLENFNVVFHEFYLLFYMISILPFIQLYSFVTYFLLKFLHNSLSKFLIFSIFNFVICMLLCIEFGKVDIRTSYIGSAYGFLIFFGFILISIGICLFTFLPYALSFFIEKKRNIFLDDSIFIKNKFLLCSTLSGTFLYILTCILCIIATILILVS